MAKMLWVRMVWPLRSRNASKVSIRSGAEPEMKSRMWRQASRVSPGSASSRQKGSRSRTASVSITASTPGAATWTRQSWLR